MSSCLVLGFLLSMAVWAVAVIVAAPLGYGFCTSALKRVKGSGLSLGWMKLGIVHERIQAGRPQQNGRHEDIGCTHP
jgi:hypothetical protein